MNCQDVGSAVGAVVFPKFALLQVMQSCDWEFPTAIENSSDGYATFPGIRLMSKDLLDLISLSTYPV
jgi:hypothetical protein